MTLSVFLLHVFITWSALYKKEQNIEIVFFIAGEHLNFEEYIPTYATVTDQQISKGVNYASGGSGIRDETGSHLVIEHNKLPLK